MNRTDCKKCTLTIPPKYKNNATVMFIGLSAKPDTETLCPSTNTGKLIAKIENRLEKTLGIHKTNIVKCAPLDKNGKLRYPTEKEMSSCLPFLSAELQATKPRIIVPLGGQVTRFLIKNLGDGTRFTGFPSDYWYDIYTLSLATALPIHHPSYIWVYKRKQTDLYVERVSKQLLRLALT